MIQGMSSIVCRRLCGAAASVALIASITGLSSSSSSSSSSRNFSQFLRRDGSAATLDLSDARTIVALILGAVGSSISSAGGIGGGGLFVPLFNLLLGFNIKTAAVLSNVMIFGGKIANMMWISFQRDPSGDHRPLIDFDAAMLMQPNMLLGISLGVLCNVMFPGWLITLLLIATLVFVTIRSAKSGFRLWEKESRSKTADLHDLEAKNGLDAPLLDPDPPQGEQNPPRDKPDRRCGGLPALKLSGLLLVWLFFFAVQLFLTNELEECGTSYWLITASQLPLTIIFTIWTIRQVAVSSAKVVGSKWNASQSRIHITLPVMAFFAGILGGLLGIGGGMLVTPILLDIGMPIQVTAATTAFIIFFSSSLSVVQYWLMGQIPVEFALWFAGICFGFSLVGLAMVQRLIRSYGRASIIVFLVTSVMGTSAVLVAGFGSMDVWEQYQRGDYMGFRWPC